MNKTYLVWFAFLAILLLGCRSDNFNPNETSNQQALKFRVVPRSEIPQIINVLQAKTNNLNVPLKNHSSAMGKTETVFGEINTNYIIETTNGTDEVFYTFPITPNAGNDGSETYNLVVKTDDTDTESAKVLVYEPTAEWAQNGNNDYLTFSGTVNNYSLDGNLESSVSYLNGTGNCGPEPCPDCPTTPTGPGNPGGPGGPGGGGPTGPGTGTPPGTGGPVSYPGNGGSSPGTPPTNPPSNGPSPGQTGTTSGGLPCYWTCVFDENDQCTKMECIEVKPPTFTANRAPANTCDQNHNTNGGVVITTQQDLCTKSKALLANTNIDASITQLKNNAINGTGEMGFKATKAGIPSPMINGGTHSLDFGYKTGYAGGYHNHTKKGIPMHSPPDIDQLLGFARAQGNQGNLTEAFVGMVAPNGMHYIIRFTGTYQDALTNFSQEQLDKLEDDYRDREDQLTSTILNGFSYINSDGSINNKGVEKLLLDTLKKMGLSGKINLQRIENTGIIKNINLDSNNQPIGVPCP